MADDLGYADLSCYGRPDFNTPNIDRLAAQGMRFTQAYANSAVCSRRGQR
jgi:arylsulfatase A-like enzyme